MLKKLSWVIIIIFISIIIAGGVVYYFLLEGIASPEPVVTKNIFSDSALPEIGDTEDDINIDDREFNQDRQKLMLEEQQKNLEKIKYEINKDIETALTGIQEKYQEKINKRETLLSEGLDNFIKTKEQEFRERLIAKREIYQQKIEKMSAEIRDNRLKDLELYRDKLDKKYYNQILNYNLKLNLLELTEKEEEKYLNELAKIEKEKERLITEKKNEIEEQVRKDIDELETKYNQKIALFKEELNATINRQIREKEDTIQKDLLEFVSTQQALMKEEMKEKREKLIARGSKELEYQRLIVQDLKKEYERMQNG